MRACGEIEMKAHDYDSTIIAKLSLAFLLLLPTSAFGQGSLLSSEPIRFTGDLLRKGLKLLNKPIIEVNCQFYFDFHFPPFENETPQQTGTGGSLDMEIGKCQARLASEPNASIKRELRLVLAQLQTYKRRNELLEKQNQANKEIAGVLIQQLDYTKERDQALLRKSFYEDLPTEKLVVVVADFSGGETEGKEIADEIGFQLRNLQKLGIDVHVLVGEIKPGIVIRNEAMAADLGRHFPDQTDFVVIWGSLSPRTVGLFHPNLTVVHRTIDNKGIKATYSLELDAQPLPEEKDAEAYRRECYERLIGLTCAAIPSCFASHEITRDRPPNLEKYFDFIGNETNEAKQLKTELEPLTKWIGLKNANKLSHFRRLSALSKERPYPTTIINNIDGGLMTLIRDKNGSPKTFMDKSNRPYVAYIDVLETTNQQYVDFLKAKGGVKKEGGSNWIEFDNDGNYRDIYLSETPPIRVKYTYSPVINVSWYGAKAYCRWSGKDLPSVVEWQAAALSKKENGEYPWGDGFEPNENQCNSESDSLAKYNAKGGTFPLDRSLCGCFDLAGNLAEWCNDWSNESKGQKTVCGGSYQDADASLFRIDSQRPVEAVSHQRWVGFRGIVRAYLD